MTSTTDKKEKPHDLLEAHVSKSYVINKLFDMAPV